jgi:hypothetical protein
MVLQDSSMDEAQLIRADGRAADEVRGEFGVTPVRRMWYWVGLMIRAYSTVQ